MIAVDGSTLKDRIDLAISRLMAAKIDGERARISVPVLYPSGSSSAIEVITSGDKCLVSDIALGHLEAEMYGAQEFYDHCARNAADKFGVGYDGLSVFGPWAPLDRIEGAIAAVANASVNAATTAIYRAIQEKEKLKDIELYEKITAIFGERAVAKRAEIGGRDAVWDAHNVVTLPDHRKAVFEFVSENSNSISSKFMMFSDLSKIGSSLSLNSVVKSVDGIGKKGAMLADVSNVISLSAPRSDFLRYAEAA